ncbi:MAG: hypothetical protein QXL67_03440, partial [Candidatus Bathyarchaeia archaeon]
ILSAHEEKKSKAEETSIKTNLSYKSVLHHLKLLEREGIVGREGKRPYTWFLTGLGQLRLEEALRKRPTTT